MVQKLKLIGRVFHYLTVIEMAESKNGKTRWVCQCVCGVKTVVAGHELTRKTRQSQQSCGCKKYALIGKANTTHGKSQHPLYWIWRSMKARCLNKKHQAYANYGGRGISVTPQWLIFDNFYADVAPSYVSGLTLDREDNDGNYEPSNFRWVDRTTQANNRRRNTYISTPEGVMTVAQASRTFKINITTILYRVAQNWPTKDLLLPPSSQKRNR